MSACCSSNLTLSVCRPLERARDAGHTAPSPPLPPLITSVEKQVMEKQGGSFTGFFTLIYESEHKLTGKANCRNGISVHYASVSYRT